MKNTIATMTSLALFGCGQEYMFEDLEKPEPRTQNNPQNPGNPSVQPGSTTVDAGVSDLCPNGWFYNPFLGICMQNNGPIAAPDTGVVDAGFVPVDAGFFFPDAQASADAAPVPVDAGMMPADVGETVADAGTVAVDAGHFCPPSCQPLGPGACMCPSVDSGVAVDAGVASVDTGVQSVDAGVAAPDAGFAPLDSGVSADTGVPYDAGAPVSYLAVLECSYNATSRVMNMRLDGAVSRMLLPELTTGATTRLGTIVAIELDDAPACQPPTAECHQFTYRGDNRSNEIETQTLPFRPRVKTNMTVDGVSIPEVFYLDLRYLQMVDSDPSDGVRCVVMADPADSGRLKIYMAPQ